MSQADPHGLRGTIYHADEDSPGIRIDIGAAARFQIEYNGKQPGDPKRAAKIVLQVAAMDESPLRLLLGSDAVKIVEQADLARMESDRRWRRLSSSSDFREGVS